MCQTETQVQDNAHRSIQLRAGKWKEGKDRHKGTVNGKACQVRHFYCFFITFANCFPLSVLTSSLRYNTTSAPPPTSSQCCIDENTPPTRPGPPAMPASSHLTPNLLALPQKSYVNPQSYIAPYNIYQHLQHPQGYSPEVYMDYPHTDYSNPSQYLHPTPMPSSSVSNTSTYIASPYAIDPNYGHYPTTSPSSFPSTYSSLDQYSSFPPSQPPHNNHHHYS